MHACVYVCACDHLFCLLFSCCVPQRVVLQDLSNLVCGCTILSVCLILMSTRWIYVIIHDGIWYAIETCWSDKFHTCFVSLNKYSKDDACKTNQPTTCTLNVGLHSGFHRPISFKLGMMIYTTKVCILIQVPISFKITVDLERKKCAHFPEEDFKLGVMFDITKLHSSIPVFMTLIVTQSHRVT